MMRTIPILLLTCALFLGTDKARAEAMTNQDELATFAGGCYWCIEAVFQQVKGVKSVRSGFIGGKTANPSYDDVCSGMTGHAEAVEVRFDPSVVTYDELLDWFWRAHDPTQLNRQGGDIGTQYRSAIFYHSEEQKKQAETSIAALAASGVLDEPIVTKTEKATEFYEADKYHQNYYRNNSNAPYCTFVIRPKLKKLGLKP